MDWFKYVKDCFEKGLYTESQVQVFADRGKITKKQAKEIIKSKDKGGD